MKTVVMPHFLSQLVYFFLCVAALDACFQNSNGCKTLKLVRYSNLNSDCNFTKISFHPEGLGWNVSLIYLFDVE